MPRFKMSLKWKYCPTKNSTASDARGRRIHAGEDMRGNHLIYWTPNYMNNTTHNSIVSFIWGIADDVLRDVYVRGKYRDVILPMTVIRRIDCLLEPTKDQVIGRNEFLEKKKPLRATPCSNG